MFNRFFSHGLLIITILSLAIYHLIKINSLENEISELEKNVIVGQHKYLACEQNINKLNNIIDKQNSRLKSINDDFKNNMKKYTIWKNAEDKKKYNDKLLNIFNSTSSTEIANKLNNIDFLNEIN